MSLQRVHEFRVHLTGEGRHREDWEQRLHEDESNTAYKIQISFLLSKSLTSGFVRSEE